MLLIPYVIVFSADKPDTVRLESNATENSDCSELLLVKFACNVSDSNPPIIKYYLVGDDEGVTFSNSGIWIQPVSKGGKHVYSCLAQHALENITSSDNVSLTVNGKFLLIALLHKMEFRSFLQCVLHWSSITMPAFLVIWRTKCLKDITQNQKYYFSRYVDSRDDRIVKLDK